MSQHKRLVDTTKPAASCLKHLEQRRGESIPQPFDQFQLLQPTAGSPQCKLKPLHRYLGQVHQLHILKAPQISEQIPQPNRRDWAVWYINLRI